ncbi:MAG TPA: cupin domain-containing protein [Rhizomicrobium sp.]|jgi:hypothetical protein
MARRKASHQTDILESLSAYAKRSERYSEALSTEKLIVSTDLKVAALREGHGVRKTPVVWPLWDYKMFYIVDVPADTDLPSHSHDEAVFRVLLSGSLTINGRRIAEPGTWYVVPAYTEYRIATKTGYRAMSCYVRMCRTTRQQALRARRKRPA